MDYQHYTAEDFAADDSFRDWVLVPTAASERFWTDFLREYPERHPYVAEGKRLVAGLYNIGQSGSHGPFIRTVWSRIETTLNELEAPLTSRQWGRTGWKIAASVAVIVGLAGWWVSRYQPETIAFIPPVAVLPGEWTEAVNGAGQTMDIQLPDGSRVRLGKHSRLKYPQAFSDAKREVYLTGQAFFDVTKNPKSPFLVYANSLVTKVLGTSFEINADPDSPDVTVAVRTGRVSVYAHDSDQRRDAEARGVILVPNQKAVFDRNDASIRKALVDKPVLLITPDEAANFVFEAAPAAEVFHALGTAYGIDVVFDEETLRNCHLTINLTDEDLYQKLEVISKVLDVQYKFIDGQIVIFSKGC